MTRPLLLDLFCGAGGAAMGYHRAGFDVIGVDIEPQPHYPFEILRADAVQSLDLWFHGLDRVYLAGEFDAVHASPPCQAYSAMSACRPGLADEYPALVDAMRSGLRHLGVPWVLENVPGAGLATAPSLDGRDGIMLCGAMFDRPLYRHRHFETNVALTQPHHPQHRIPASKAGHWTPGTIISVSGNCSPIAVAREAMGIDWMNRDELSEAIPPAYTEFIGSQLLEHLERAA